MRSVRHFVSFRMAASLVVTNNYMHIYNLNQFGIKLYIDPEEEDDEVM